MKATEKTGAKPPRLGVQLYTVRSLTDDATFRETVTALAGLGFEGVEFAWKYGGMAPEALAEFLRSLGLRCCGLHVPLDDLRDPRSLAYEYAAACASPYVTTSLCSRMEEWESLIPLIREAAAVARGRGVQFTYHNHWQEFQEIRGVYALDMLRDQTGPEIQFELDLGWARRGGAEPMQYWTLFGGRVPQIHLRDYDAVKGEVCDVGAGFLDVAAVARQAMAVGTEWLIYEQDNYPVSPLASADVCVRQWRAAARKRPGRRGKA